MCHLSGLVRCGYHGPCYPHSKDGHQRREGQRLNVFPLWMWLSSHSSVLHSLKFKECSFSSFPPYEVFFFLVTGGSGRSGAKKLKKAGLKSSWHSEFTGGFILCIAQISHETQVQIHSLGVVGISVFPMLRWNKLVKPVYPSKEPHLLPPSYGK